MIVKMRILMTPEFYNPSCLYEILFLLWGNITFQSHSDTLQPLGWVDGEEIK